MIKQVILHESIERYDLIYFTQNNSEEDVNYFKELSVSSECSQYVYIEKKRFDIFNHLAAYRAVLNNFKIIRYSKVVASSFDSIAIRRLSVRNKYAKIISFDDGAKHIVKKSVLLAEKNIFRSNFYSFLFGIPSVSNFIKRISVHYSAYRNFENIMPKEIVRYVDPFSFDRVDGLGKITKFFIGQPFADYDDKSYIENLKKYLEKLEFDFYVKHPRESFPLVEGVTLLAKEGRIAEEAIFIACADHRPLIVGGFTSVLINISPDLADKIMILPANLKSNDQLSEMGAAAGCKIVYI